ncbi:MAG TPA: glycosyltransferase family 2 protein [Spirochaetota bacterium]|nr:glycosyltransferase family 2 protein [Spirochaetota bacterium]
MKVSIITVAYNAEETIESCIQNVIKQNYQNIEYLIIDGESTDRTLEIIEKYKDKIAKVVSEKDNGIYDAMNKGVRESSGDIVGFINADDFFDNENVISEIVDNFKKNDVDCCYGDILYFDEKDSNKIVRVWRTKNFSKKMFFDGSFPPHPSFYAKKECYNKYGFYKTDFKIASDFELMLRFMQKNSIKSAYIPKILVKMRSGGAANKNGANIITGLKESKASFKLNGLPYPSLFTLKTLLFRFMQQFLKKV